MKSIRLIVNIAGRWSTNQSTRRYWTPYLFWNSIEMSRDSLQDARLDSSFLESTSTISTKTTFRHWQILPWRRYFYAIPPTGMALPTLGFRKCLPQWEPITERLPCLAQRCLQRRRAGHQGISIKKKSVRARRYRTEVERNILFWVQEPWIQGIKRRFLCPYERRDDGSLSCQWPQHSFIKQFGYWLSERPIE